MTPTGASRIIRSTKSVRAWLTRGSPNARNRVATSSSSRDTSRPRSTRAAGRPAEAPRSTAGAARCSRVRNGGGSQGTSPAGLLHGDRLAGHPAGPAMAALIPEDQPGSRGQIAPLVVPAVLVQREPVAEDDRDRGVVRAVDLHVQRRPVRGKHDELAAAQFPERLIRRRVRVQPQPVRSDPLGRDDCARGRHGSARGDSGDPPPPGHVSSRLCPVRPGGLCAPEAVSTRTVTAENGTAYQPLTYWLLATYPAGEPLPPELLNGSF